MQKMHKFTRKLLTNWRRLSLPFSDRTVILSVSGGADSVSLLFAINDLRRRSKLDHRFIVAHFDHGIRGVESAEDAEYVNLLADELGFEFALGHGQIETRGNLEQNARTARYRFLFETAVNNGAFAVLTAHTINDQAETFLMNLIRGSGPDGLRAMSAIRPLTAGEISAGLSNRPKSKPGKSDAEIMLVRPILDWATRTETEEFCRDMGVEFRTDAMNSDPAFTRVRIRRELIPLLSTFNPKILETLARTARLIGTHGDAVSKIDIEDAIALSSLKGLAKDEICTVLRCWIKQRRGNMRSLQLKHIEAIEHLVNSRKSGKTVELPGGSRVIKSGGMLVWEDKG